MEGGRGQVCVSAPSLAFELISSRNEVMNEILLKQNLALRLFEDNSEIIGTYTFKIPYQGCHQSRPRANCVQQAGIFCRFCFVLSLHKLHLNDASYSKVIVDQFIPKSIADSLQKIPSDY